MEEFNYEIIDKLGFGGYGTVYKAKRPDGKLIALKVIDIDPENTKMIEITKNEVKFLTQLSTPKCNPFVVCYYGSFYDKVKGKFYIEMEYIDGDEMLKFVMDMAEKDIPKLYRLLVAIAKDLSEGLKYIHSKGIIHNDMKLENVMIQRGTNIPKIIDFGLACNKKKFFNYCKSGGGSPIYIPPEFVKEDTRRYPASDMWALGVILYAGATGNYPNTVSYTDDKDTDVQNLFEQIVNNPISKLKTSNITLNKIVNGLLVKNPRERLTPDGVLKIINEGTGKFNFNLGIEYNEKEYTILNKNRDSMFM